MGKRTLLQKCIQFITIRTPNKQDKKELAFLLNTRSKSKQNYGSFEKFVI